MTTIMNVSQHTDFADRTSEEVASSLAAPGTAPYVAYLDTLARTLTANYQALLNRYFDAWVDWCRRKAGPVARVRCDNAELVAMAREQFLWKATVTDYALTEEHVKKITCRYSPHWLIQSDNPGWPTSWWFRFAQLKWEKSTWFMVPDFPPGMLALAGYHLVTTSRWMGEDVLTDEQRLAFVLLQRKWQFYGKDSLTIEEHQQLEELFDRMPYGGELPILDIDASNVKDRPEGQGLTDEQIEAVHRGYAETGARYALAVTEVWRKITGVTPRWTVTNDRGGLHGLSLALPPHVRHPHLLRSLMHEMRRELEVLGVATKVKAESKATGAPVTLDLTAYNKWSAGRGGMWRVPLCAKDKPGSIPQAPVGGYVRRMPWLAPLTPEALGSDWRTLQAAACARVLAIAEAHKKAIEDQEVRGGRAFRDPVTNEVRRVRRPSAPSPDFEITGIDLTCTATTIREIMPVRGGGGPSRHAVRVALAGWLLENNVPAEKAIEALMASGGNPEDARDAVQSTAHRLASGRRVASADTLRGLLGEDAYRRLCDAYMADEEERDRAEEARRGREGEPEDPEPPRDRPEPEPEPEPGPDASRTETAAPPAAPSSAWDSISEGAGPTASGAPPDQAAPTPSAPAVSPLTTPTDAAAGESATKKMVVFGNESIPKSLTNPLSAHHLSFVSARERLARPESHWTPGKNGGALRKLMRWLEQAKRRTGNKFYFVCNVIGPVLAFAGVGRATIRATSREGESKYEHLFNGYTKAMRELVAWRPGAALPRIPSLSWLRKTCGYKLWSELLDAIQQDLKHAPFDVQQRALIDQSRSSEERDTISWLLDSIEASGETLNDPRLAKKEWKRIREIARCGRLANERICASHGLVATIPIYCDSEVGCRQCRFRMHATIADWVSAYWLHQKYVIFRWEAGTDPVRVEVREGAHTDDPNFEEDMEAKWLAPARGAGDRQEGRNKRFVIKRDKENEVVALIARAIRNKGRSEKGKYLGTVLSMDLLDRIKKGFRASRDFQVFQATTENGLPFRAYPTPTGLLVIMLDTFNLEPHGGGMPDEQNTLRHLQLVDAFQRFKPRVVTKDEMLSELLRARLEVGEEFDRLVHELVKESALSPSPVGPDGGRSAAEIAVLTYPFLRDRAMEAVRNDAALEHLPWYDGESLREFKKALRVEKHGPDLVKPNECPVMVLKPDGTSEPCRRILGVVLKDQRTGEIFADNSTGRHYDKKEAWKIAAERCHSFGTLYPSRHGPVPEACSHGELAHAHC